MKIILLTLLISFHVKAQINNMFSIENYELSNHGNQATFDKKHLIKLNFPFFNQPTISIQYEYNFLRKFTAGASLNYDFKQEFLPLKIIRKHKIENDFVNHQLKKIKTTSFSFAPEIRYYFGKEVYKGFYISPFVRFSNYNVNFPLQYIEDELEKHYQEVSFSGKFKTVTYGLSLGAQWNVYKNFYVDWLIIGPHIGKSNERFILDSNLNSLQQKGIKKSLDLIKTTIEETNGIPDINFDYTVNEKGGEIKIKNPWAGLRLQIGFGYRF